MDGYSSFLVRLEAAIDQAAKSSEALASGKGVLLGPESAIGDSVEEAMKLHSDIHAREAKQVERDIEEIDRLVKGGGGGI